MLSKPLESNLNRSEVPHRPHTIGRHARPANKPLASLARRSSAAIRHFQTVKRGELQASRTFGQVALGSSSNRPKGQGWPHADAAAAPERSGKAFETGGGCSIPRLRRGHERLDMMLGMKLLRIFRGKKREESSRKRQLRETVERLAPGVTKTEILPGNSWGKRRARQADLRGL